MAFINNLVLPLVFTIIIECFTVFLLGRRERLFLVSVILVNIITNPALNFVLLFIQHFGFAEYYYFFLMPLEVLVVIAEWKMLEYAAGKQKQSLLLLSLLMNGISFAVGLLL